MDALHMRCWVNRFGSWTVLHAQRGTIESEETQPQRKEIKMKIKTHTHTHTHSPKLLWIKLIVYVKFKFEHLSSFILSYYRIISTFMRDSHKNSNASRPVGWDSFLACHDFPLTMVSNSLLSWSAMWAYTRRTVSISIHENDDDEEEEMKHYQQVTWCVSGCQEIRQVFSFFGYKLHDNVQNLYTSPINLSFFTLSINEISVLLTVFFSNSTCDFWPLLLLPLCYWCVCVCMVLFSSLFFWCLADFCFGISP